MLDRNAVSSCFAKTVLLSSSASMAAEMYRGYCAIQKMDPEEHTKRFDHSMRMVIRNEFGKHEALVAEMREQAVNLSKRLVTKPSLQ